jgi:hypothetical protein
MCHAIDQVSRIPAELVEKHKPIRFKVTLSHVYIQGRADPYGEWLPGEYKVNENLVEQKVNEWPPEWRQPANQKQLRE